MAVSRHSTEQESDFSTGLCFLVLAERDTSTLRLTSHQFINPSGGKNNSFSVVPAKVPELILIDPAYWATLEPIIIILIYQRWVILP